MNFAQEALEWTVEHGGKDGLLPFVVASNCRSPRRGIKALLSAPEARDLFDSLDRRLSFTGRLHADGELR